MHAGYTYARCQSVREVQVRERPRLHSGVAVELGREIGHVRSVVDHFVIDGRVLAGELPDNAAQEFLELLLSGYLGGEAFDLR